MNIGITPGRIAEIKYTDSTFTIKFESDNGVFDCLPFNENERQLSTISKLFGFEPSTSLTGLVGEKVNLIFGPIISPHSNHAMLYGIGNEENGNMFIIPEYLFEIVSKEMDKEFYSESEALDFMEEVESSL